MAREIPVEFDALWVDGKAFAPGSYHRVRFDTNSDGIPETTLIKLNSEQVSLPPSTIVEKNHLLNQLRQQNELPVSRQDLLSSSWKGLRISKPEVNQSYPYDSSNQNTVRRLMERPAGIGSEGQITKVTGQELIEQGIDGITIKEHGFQEPFDVRDITAIFKNHLRNLAIVCWMDLDQQLQFRVYNLISIQNCIYTKEGDY